MGTSLIFDFNIFVYVDNVKILPDAKELLYRIVSAAIKISVCIKLTPPYDSVIICVTYIFTIIKKSRLSDFQIKFLILNPINRVVVE